MKIQYLGLLLLLCNMFCFPMRVVTIPVVELRSGESTEIDLNYFVYNPKKEKIKLQMLEVTKGLNIKPTEDAKLLIRADTGFYGLATAKIKVSLAGESSELSLLLRVYQPRLVEFRFKPKQPVKEVYLAGEFNSWNWRANKLIGPDKDGYYKVVLDLPAGTYQYKFVIDGKRWVEDPENPNKVSDGFGGYNSIITVEDDKVGRFIPLSKKVSDKQIKYILKYLTTNDNKLAENTIVVKLNNNVLPKRNVVYDSHTQHLEITVDSPHQRCEISVNALTTTNKLVPEYWFCENLNDKIFDWRDAVIYFVFTDRFYNGDKTNDKPIDDPEVAPIANYLGGDFAGIIKKIKEGYFTKLGVNTLWISPVVKNPDKAYRDALPPHRKFTGYHGYWPVSVTEVEPRFGTMEELKELITIAHNYGIKVIFDMVVNHVHEENIVYKQNPHWFTQLILPDGRKNIRLFDERPYDTWFDEFLPSFDYEKNPQAVEFMVENCLWWIEQTNCDGFRLDAVKHIPHCFWKRLRLELRQKVELPFNKKFYLIGETISSREKIMEYVNPYELDGQFDFPLYWVIRDVFAFNKQGFPYLEKERLKSETMYKNSLMSIFLGNHDFARFISYANGDIKPSTDEKEIAWTDPPKKADKLAYSKLKLAFSFVLTQSMVPLIYYGDEIGLLGAGDPDNRRVMQFDKLTRQQKDVLNFVATLLRLRTQHPALRYGVHYTLLVLEDVYVYAKKYFDDTVIIAMNKSHKDAVVTVTLPEWLVKTKILKDALSSKKIKILNNEIKVKIPAMSSLVITEI